MPTIFDKRVAVRVTKTTESPHLVRKSTQIAELSAVIPEQSKYMKPVDMAILNMMPQGYPDLTANLHERLRANNPEKQNNTLWFPTPENPGEPEVHTLIRTRTLRILNELTEKEKLNSQENTDFRTNFFGRLD